ncbi:MAG TPA: hypothetical protein DHV33_00370, partial [Candidatus Moranbacteria bacterium]|nr:hypothetical protein [Candidatus Moranbacteria bacterium]
GIGTNAPAYALDVLATGTGAIARFHSANATGCTLATDGTLTCTSDERFKKNIVSLGSSLDLLNSLRPVEYNWKYQADGETKNFGFIAQEVETVFPRLVMTDANGYKELNTIGLIPVIVEAVKEQQSQIADVTLKTDQNVTTLAGLQSSIDTQLSVVGAEIALLKAKNIGYDASFINDLAHLTTLDDTTAKLRIDLTLQTSKVALLETQVASLMDFYASFDLGKSVMKDVAGNIDLTIDSLGKPVTLGGKLKAVVLETGELAITVIDPLAPTIGTAEVLPVAIDANADGNDDYSLLPMTDPAVTSRDGKSVQIMTKAMIPMVNGSRIFTTWKNNPSGFSWVEKTKDANDDFVGFQIKLSTPVTTPAKVDWLLIEQKGNLAP